VVKDGIETTRSIELNNPAIHLIAQKDTERIYEGTIRLGEGAVIGSHTMTFEDIRYWVDFFIVREFGIIPLTAGFVIAAIGLIMRLVFYQKRLRLLIADEGGKSILYIDGRSEYFQHSFKDEMDKLVKRLERFLLK
jgi:hypothetical protein